MNNSLFSGIAHIKCLKKIAQNKNLSIMIGDGINDILDMNLKVTEDYYSSFCKSKIITGNLSCREFIADEDVPELKQLMCPEIPLPSQYLSAISLEPSEYKISSVLAHAGRKGNMTPLHFDWDHHWVLHVCLSGEKSFFFFPPEQGWLLNPIINTSAYKIPVFVETDQSDFLKRLGGEKINLKAGEAVLFPSMWWHGVSYGEHSVALSIRFEHSSFLKGFTIFPRSWLLQRIVWHLFCVQDKKLATDTLEKIAIDFLSVFEDWYARYLHMQKLYRSILIDFGFQGYGIHEWIDANFNPEIILAKDDLCWSYTLNNSSFILESSDIISVKNRFYLDDLFPDSALHIPLIKYILRFKDVS